MSPLKCAQCNHYVFVLDSISINNQIYHPACFTCHLCKTHLTSNDFILYDRNPYCLKHVPIRKAETPKMIRNPGIVNAPNSRADSHCLNNTSTSSNSDAKRSSQNSSIDEWLLRLSQCDVDVNLSHINSASTPIQTHAPHPAATPTPSANPASPLHRSPSLEQASTLQLQSDLSLSSPSLADSSPNRSQLLSTPVSSMENLPIWKQYATSPIDKAGFYSYNFSGSSASCEHQHPSKLTMMPVSPTKSEYILRRRDSSDTLYSQKSNVSNSALRLTSRLSNIKSSIVGVTQSMKNLAHRASVRRGTPRRSSEKTLNWTPKLGNSPPSTSPSSGQFSTSPASSLRSSDVVRNEPGMEVRPSPRECVKSLETSTESGKENLPEPIFRTRLTNLTRRKPVKLSIDMTLIQAKRDASDSQGSEAAREAYDKDRTPTQSNKRLSLLSQSPMHTPVDERAAQSKAGSGRGDAQLAETLGLTDPFAFNCLVDDSKKRKTAFLQPSPSIMLANVTVVTLEKSLSKKCEDLAHTLQRPSTQPLPCIEDILDISGQIQNIVAAGEGNVKDLSLARTYLTEWARQLAPTVMQNKDNERIVVDAVRGVESTARECVLDFLEGPRRLVVPTTKYQIEGRNRRQGGYEVPRPADPGKPVDYGGAAVDHMDTGCEWFRFYFLGKEHRTYCGEVEGLGKVVISAVREPLTNVLAPTSPESARGTHYQYRLIVRRRELPDIRLVIPEWAVALPHPRSFLSLRRDAQQAQASLWDEVVRMSHPKIDPAHLHMLPVDPFESRLLKLDEMRFSRRYKFGVLYIAPGQTSEEAWFANREGSAAFNRFLEVLGRKVPLKGFDGFTGGLDTRGGESGEWTYYDRTWREFEVAYHVSTLLPFREGDRHQIARKRHIGNDIVCLVFLEGEQAFDPAAIKSQFLHIFIVVCPEPGDAYRVEVVVDRKVPEFGPPLPDPPVFRDPKELKAFLLAKMINGENAAYKSPRISAPHLRARQGYLEDMVAQSTKGDSPLPAESDPGHGASAKIPVSAEALGKSLSMPTDSSARPSRRATTSRREINAKNRRSREVMEAVS
ncbi:uncharacterized protein VTP21DRAFT_5946 [Calcarisporiella thermophila]|uniref:uncharacterized protein n=1 Tax=Calcarisporiella thermophila TaxID=911321 RepID=UPI003743CAA7